MLSKRRSWSKSWHTDSVGNTIPTDDRAKVVVIGEGESTGER